MKLFLSHSSRDKALIREIQGYLPSFITTWLDEGKLTVGTNLENSINEAINNDADYFLYFISRDIIKSKWMQKEFKWAMQLENKLGRTFILPILLDDIWHDIKPVSFKKRLYLKCLDQSELGVRSFVDNLSLQLFHITCNRLENSATINNENFNIVYTSRREMPASKHFNELLSQVDTSLTIVGVSLNFVIGQSLSSVFDLLKNNPKAVVNILMFNPGSKSLGFMSKFTNKTTKSLRNEISSNIETITTRLSNEFNKTSVKRIKIRLYDAPPLFSMTLINKEGPAGLMLLEYFQYKGDTDDRISIEIPSTSIIYRKYLHSYKLLWREALQLQINRPLNYR